MEYDRLSIIFKPNSDKIFKYKETEYNFDDADFHEKVKSNLKNVLNNVNIMNLYDTTDYESETPSLFLTCLEKKGVLAHEIKIPVTVESRDFIRNTYTYYIDNVTTNDNIFIKAVMDVINEQRAFYENSPPPAGYGVGYGGKRRTHRKKRALRKKKLTRAHRKRRC